MELNIKVAIFGLVGVIIGGLINTGTTILVDGTRERANRQRESRKYAVELKRASRLIDAELSRAQAAAKICVEKKRWWSQDVNPLQRKHGSSLAAPLLRSYQTPLGWR
jgi:hypothetical protein